MRRKRLLTPPEHGVLDQLKNKIDAGWQSGQCKIRNWSDMDYVYLTAKVKDKKANLKGVIYSDPFSGESDSVIQPIKQKARKGFRIKLG